MAGLSVSKPRITSASGRLESADVDDEPAPRQYARKQTSRKAPEYKPSHSRTTADANVRREAGSLPGTSRRQSSASSDVFEVASEQFRKPSISANKEAKKAKKLIRPSEGRRGKSIVFSSNTDIQSSPASSSSKKSAAEAVDVIVISDDDSSTEKEADPKPRRGIYPQVQMTSSR